jgi:hypothetical protein
MALVHLNLNTPNYSICIQYYNNLRLAPHKMIDQIATWYTSKDVFKNVFQQTPINGHKKTMHLIKVHGQICSTSLERLAHSQILQKKKDLYIKQI